MPGLVPDEVFFAHLAERRFPSTCFIRRADQLDYLSEPDEVAMLQRRLDRGSAEPVVAGVIDAEALTSMREAVEQVTVHGDILGYVVSLASGSRQHPC